MSMAYGFSEYGGPETQQFFDVPVPSPGPGQLLVAVHAAGVNPADWKVRAGTRKDTVPVTLPAVLGREVAGVVADVGPRVTGFAVGDAVFGATATGFGGYTEYTLVNTASAAHKPEPVSFADAATLPVAAGTAYDALTTLDLAPGSRLLVVGAGGGVGVAALQLAAAWDVTVIGVASESKSRARASGRSSNRSVPPGWRPETAWPHAYPARSTPSSTSSGVTRSPRRRGWSRIRRRSSAPAIRSPRGISAARGWNGAERPRCSRSWPRWWPTGPSIRGSLTDSRSRTPVTLSRWSSPVTRAARS